MTILSDELTNDPLARGYSTMSDLEAANDLNLVRIEVNRTVMSGSELLGHADALEWNLRTAEQKSNWLSLCGIDSIDPFGSAVQVVISVWGAGSVTIGNLQAARVETISRAQQLGITVNEGDVNHARAI